MFVLFYALLDVCVNIYHRFLFNLHIFRRSIFSARGKWYDMLSVFTSCFWKIQESCVAIEIVHDVIAAM